MSREFNVSQLAVTMSLFAVGLVLSTTANANTLLNGNFSQIGMNGNPVCSSNPASPGGPSAAANWVQWALVTNSSLCTRVETTGIGLSHLLHVWTNGGDSPPNAMGNGMGQSFPVMGCASASFLIQVLSGEVTGNLVRADGPFVYYPTFKPIGGYKPYRQVTFRPVVGLWFETLNPVGIIPGPQPAVNYTVMNAEVGPCLVAVKDLSYLTYEISYLRSSVGPVAKIRVTNTGSLMVEGSIHALLEKVTPGFRVINPDGDYLDSPFVTLPSTALAPGESAEVTVQFDTQSTGAVPEFHVRLISGL